MVRERLIDDDEYNRRLRAQGGGCAICGEIPVFKKLAVDHDHKTGKVRGLLCFRCNTALGAFGDSIELLEVALDYLEAHDFDELTDTATYTERRAEWVEVYGDSLP